MPRNLEVRIDSSRPIFVTAEPKDIAEIFAHSAADVQAEILRLAFASIKTNFPLQADYIWMELAKPKHDETREHLAYLLSPMPEENPDD